MIFCPDLSKEFDLMMVLICSAHFLPLIQVNFCWPIDVIVSYSTEPKNIVTKTILVAITAFLRAFSSINK